MHTQLSVLVDKKGNLMSVCVPDTGANIEVKGAIIMSLKIVVRGVDIVIDRQHSTEANAISLAHTNSLPQCSCGYNCSCRHRCVNE